MVIFILEPYLNDSHNYWVEGIKTHINAHVKVFSLPPKHWKWRMHASAISLAEMLKNENEPDHIIVSDMSSVSLLKALLPKDWNTYKISAYFHENQITYPWQKGDQDVVKERNNQYGFLNYTSALAADKVFFNSNYHKTVFLDSLPEFLKQFPDHKNLSTIQDIENKSAVSPIGINISQKTTENKWASEVPTILWNHRWEYDKNPEDFFNILIQLSNQGIEFQLMVLGKGGKKYPEIFDLAKEALAKHIIHWGYADSRTEYENLLSQAHLAPVTSIQDFFGISALESITAEVYPLLPNRLAFPEHLSDNSAFYDSKEDLQEMLEEITLHWKKFSPVLKDKSKEYASEITSKYEWKQICKHLLNDLSSI